MNAEDSLKLVGRLVAGLAFFVLLGSHASKQVITGQTPLPFPTPASDPPTTALTVGNDESPPGEEAKPFAPVHYVFPDLDPNVTTLDTTAGLWLLNKRTP